MDASKESQIKTFENVGKVFMDYFSKRCDQTYLHWAEELFSDLTFDTYNEKSTQQVITDLELGSFEEIISEIIEARSFDDKFKTAVLAGQGTAKDIVVSTFQKEFKEDCIIVGQVTTIKRSQKNIDVAYLFLEVNFKLKATQINDTGFWLHNPLKRNATKEAVEEKETILNEGDKKMLLDFFHKKSIDGFNEEYSYMLQGASNIIKSKETTTDIFKSGETKPEKAQPDNDTMV